MRIDAVPLLDYQQTGRKMYEVVERYHSDLFESSVMVGQIPLEVPQLSIEQFFDICRNIPYKQDHEPVEILARPRIILEKWKADCKKKAILMGSFCRCRNIPFQFIACSQRKDMEVHHVFTQGYMRGDWQNLDCTYPEFRIFENKNVTYAEILEK